MALSRKGVGPYLFKAVSAKGQGKSAFYNFFLPVHVSSTCQKNSYGLQSCMCLIFFGGQTVKSQHI